MGKGRKEEERTAARVELRSALETSYVERDDLGAKEVVPRGDVGGDADVHLATAGVQVLSAPVVAGALPRDAGGPVVLEDLEPARGAVGRGGVRHFGQVDVHGAEVVAADGFVGAGSVAELLQFWGCQSFDGWRRGL